MGLEQEINSKAASVSQTPEHKNSRFSAPKKRNHGGGCVSVLYVRNLCPLCVCVLLHGFPQNV